MDGASKQGRGQLKGRTRTNRVVTFEGPSTLVGNFTSAEIIEARPNSLEGKRIAAPGLDLARSAVYK